jgi:carbamoyl-phosphate synthase small subunit
MSRKSYLVLSDGTVYPGRGFGFPAVTSAELVCGCTETIGSGEVVFNTGMCGYHEILTDPSYTGQIVTMTYPHIGNYGDLDEWSEVGPEDAIDRRDVKVMGLVVRSLYEHPVPVGRKTLDAYLKEQGIPGISDIDTRALTLKLRDEGNYNGVLITPESETTGLTDSEVQRILEFLTDYPPMIGRDLIGGVGTGSSQRFGGGGAPRIVLYDCGLKDNILRILLKLGCEVLVCPSTHTAAQVLEEKPQGVLFSNGPGDPAVLPHQVDVARELVNHVPTFGICLGHQLISLALGAKTSKMKFGHHGVNHPVRDELTKKVFVTSQNHGFVVEEETLPSGVRPWFRNANDHSLEGIYCDNRPVLSVQFHPEAAPGPRDSEWIIGRFMETI